MATETHKSEPLLPAFIHGDLDDRGLNLHEFRIYGKIARRGACYESVPSMAAACGMHPDSAWRALRSLLGQRLVSSEKRPGRTTIYRITPVSVWAPKISEATHPSDKGHPSTEGHPSDKLDPPGLKGHAYPSGEGCHPPGLKGHEVTPFKSIHKVAPEKCILSEVGGPVAAFGERIGKLFGRGPNDLWDPKEIRELRSIHSANPCDADIQAIERYYTSDIAKTDDRRRQSVLALLQNWPGELDRARRWNASSPAVRKKDYSIGFNQ